MDQGVDVGATLVFDGRVVRVAAAIRIFTRDGEAALLYGLRHGWLERASDRTS